MKPLIGDVTVQFTCAADDDEVMAHLEANRVEQEEMTGYPLTLAVHRKVQLQDLTGQDIYEVFATYTPNTPEENEKEDDNAA